MQRWLIFGAVIAALGALLYLHLESEAPPSRTASGEPAGASGVKPWQWRPWAPTLTEEQAAAGEASGDPQAAEASGDDGPDLPGTLSLRGQVTDERGQPLEGVHVRAAPSGQSLEFPEAETVTDTQGRFRLRSLALQFYTVAFERARFRYHTVEHASLSWDPPPLAVTLQPAPTIQGRAVDTAGNPLGGVEIQLFALIGYRFQDLALPESEAPESELPEEDRGRRKNLMLSWPMGDTRTAPDGTFIVDTFEPDTFLLQARLNGLKPLEREVTSPSKDVWLVLGGGATIEVSVVDEQDQPVPHAEVGLWRDNESSFMMELTTNETGHGVLQGLEPGQYGLAALTPPRDGLRMATASLTLSGEKTRQFRLRMEEGESLSGVVTNPAGAPIAGVEIEAVLLRYPSSDEGDPPSSWGTGAAATLRDEWRTMLSRLKSEREAAPHRVRTGPDGRFTVPHLLPAYYEVSFAKEGHRLHGLAGQADEESAPFQSLRLPSGKHGVRVVMGYVGRVSGRVVRATDGEPCSEFQLNDESFSRPDGTFTLTAKEAGLQTLQVLVPGVGGLLRSYEVHEGQDVELGDLVVGEGRPVRVKVEDSATSWPIANVSLRIEEQDLAAKPPLGAGARPSEPVDKPDGEGPLPKELSEWELGIAGRLQTGRDGSLLLPDVPTRPLVLTPYHQGYEPVSVVLAPNEQELTLRLRAWATVQGQVRVRGEPLAKGEVSFEEVSLSKEYPPGVPGRLNRLPVRNGWYSIQLLRPGHYMAYVECDSCPDPKPVFLRTPLEVPGPQGRATLDFEAAQGATLEVRAPAALDRMALIPGQHPPPATILQYDEIMKSHHPDEHVGGEAFGSRFRDVPPGRYTLLFAYATQGEEDPSFQRLDVEVPASGLLRLQLPPRELPPQRNAATGTEP
jgi:hypothetical protein